MIFDLQIPEEMSNKQSSNLETILIHKTQRFNQTFFEKQITLPGHNGYIQL